MNKDCANEVGSGAESGEISPLPDAPGSSETSQIDDTITTSDNTKIGERESDEKNQTDNTKLIEGENVNLGDETRKICNTEQKEGDDPIQTACTNKVIGAEEHDGSIVSSETIQIAQVQQYDNLKESMTQEQLKIESTRSHDKKSLDDISICNNTQVVDLSESFHESTQTPQDQLKIESTKVVDTISIDDASNTTQVVDSIKITKLEMPKINITETSGTTQIGPIKSEAVMKVDIPLRNIEGTTDSKMSEMYMTPAVGLSEIFEESTQTPRDVLNIESTKSDNTISAGDASNTIQVIDSTKIAEIEMPKINITETNDTVIQIGTIKSEDVMQVDIPLRNIEDTADSKVAEIDMTPAVDMTAFNNSSQTTDTTISENASQSNVLSLTNNETLGDNSVENIAVDTKNPTVMSKLTKKQRKWLLLQEKMKQKYGSNFKHQQEKESEIKQSNLKEKLVLQENLKQKSDSSVAQGKEIELKQSNVKDKLVSQEMLKQNLDGSAIAGQEKKSEKKQSNMEDKCDSKPTTINASVMETTSTGFQKYLQVINIVTKNPEKCQKWLQNQEQLKQKLGDKYREPVIYSTVKKFALGQMSSSQSGADKSTPEITNSLELLNVLYLNPEKCKDWLRKQLDLKNEQGEKYQEPVIYQTVKLIALHHSKVANANKSNITVAPNTNIKSVNVELNTTTISPKNVSTETTIKKTNMQKKTCTNEVNKSTNINNASELLKKDVNKEKTFKENEPKTSTLSSSKSEKETVKNDNKTSKNKEDVVYVVLSPFAEHYKVQRMLDKQKQLKCIMGAKYRAPRFDILGKKVSYYHTDTSKWVVRLPFETTTKVIKYKKDLPEIYAIDWVETQIHLFKKLGDKYKPQEYSPTEHRTQDEEVRPPAPDEFVIGESRNYYPEEQSNVQLFNNELPPALFNAGGHANNYIQPPEMYYNQPPSFYEASFYPPPMGFFASVPQTGYYCQIDPSLDYQPPQFLNQTMPVDSHCTTGYDLAPPGIGPPVEFPLPTQEASPVPFVKKFIDSSKCAAAQASTTITKDPELYSDIPLPPAHEISASIMATTNTKITNSSKDLEPSTTKIAEPKVPTNAPITPKTSTADFTMENCTGNIAFRFKGKDIYYPSYITNNKTRLTWVKQQFILYTKKGNQYTPPQFDKNGRMIPKKIEQLTTVDAKISKSELSKVKLPDSKELQPLDIPLPTSDDSALKKAAQAMVHPVAFDKFGMRINNDLIGKIKSKDVSHRTENLKKRKEREKSAERHKELRQLPKVAKQEKPKPSLNDMFVKTPTIAQPAEKTKIAVKLKKDESPQKSSISKSSEPVKPNIKSTATTSIRLAYQNARTEGKPAPPAYGNITYPGFQQTFVQSASAPKPVVTPTPSITPPLSQPSPVQPPGLIITGVPKTMTNTWFDPTENTSANKYNTGYQIHVSNLAPEIDKQHLSDAFAPFGEISDCRVVQDRRSVLSNYGFVTYLKESDAESAITTMNGQKLGSFGIQVTWALNRLIPSIEKSESFTPPLPTSPKPATKVTVAEPERTHGKSKLSAFERLGPPTEAKKPKLTINLMYAKDENAEVVREVIEEHVPVYLRQDMIASEDVIVKEYLKIWPWARTVHVLKECTHASRDIVLDEIEMSTYYSSKSAWIKVVVTGYPQHFKKEDVMDLLLKCVNSREFIPCFIEFNQKNCTFLLNRCEEALSYLHSNGLIAKKDNIEMKLKICQTNLSLDNLKFYKGAIFKMILSKNYNEETNSLDLSSFQLKPDNSHFMYFPLNIAHNQIFIMNVIKAILPSKNITTLNLSGNRLKNISSFNLSEYLPSLRILDLSNNLLPTVSTLACFRGIPMYSLSLEGNPLCRNFIQNAHYIDVVKLIFPKLITLDGIRVDSKIEFKKNFSVSMDAVDLVNTFLEIFFTLTDSNDRIQMETLYSENSVFSITCRPEMKRNPMYHNLKEFYMWCRSLNDRINPSDPLEGVIIGGPKIVRYFAKWPMVAHDPHSFTVDVIQHTETITILKVTGLFKIPAETLSQDEPVTEFSRTFVLVTEDGKEYKIANDMMYISEATPERIRSSFQTVGLQMRSADTLSMKLENSPDDDLKEKLTEIMMRLTSMKLKPSRRCLEMVNWNLKKALEYFIRLEKVGATEQLYL